MMNCPKCKYDGIPEEARFCPNCGEKMPETPKPSTEITVTQGVGSVKDGTVTGVELGQVTGDVTVESTVNQIEAKIIQGDYVDRSVIINLVVNEPHALDEILKRLTTTLGVNKQSLQNLGDAQVPENVSQQIAEVMAAQKEAATKGIPAAPTVCFELGMLAAYRRDYDAALDYFHQATQADPEYSDAFEAIAWLLQSRAMDDIFKQDYTAAANKLLEAHTAAQHTDPLDPHALALRGYIAKTLAQIAAAGGHQADREKYYQEAARMFEHVVKLNPENASAQNGLGNIQYALGNFDAAIAAYQRAIALTPTYTAAHHDLALAYEGKMQTEPAKAFDWRRKAVQAWQRTYQLAPNDPIFSAERILQIGQRLSWLESQGAQSKPTRKMPSRTAKKKRN